MRAWLGLEHWQLSGGGAAKSQEVSPWPAGGGTAERRANLRAESTWPFLGLSTDLPGTKSPLRNLESLCRLTSGQLKGPSRGRDQVWVGMSTVFFMRPQKSTMNILFLKPNDSILSLSPKVKISEQQ